MAVGPAPFKSMVKCFAKRRAGHMYRGYLSEVISHFNQFEGEPPSPVCATVQGDGIQFKVLPHSHTHS